MLEIKNFKNVNKNTLIAVFDVHIKPWNLTFNEVKLFEKGTSKWLGMPCKEYTNDKGEKRYQELISFDNENVKKRFRDQVVEAVNKFMEINPTGSEPFVNASQEMPF